MLTVAHPLKTFLQNGLKGWKKEKDRICSMWKREVPAWERLGGGGGSVPRLRLCSKSGTYVITATSTGHFFQESGPSSFYLKLWVLWHTHTHTHPPLKLQTLLWSPHFQPGNIQNLHPPSNSIPGTERRSHSTEEWVPASSWSIRTHYKASLVAHRKELACQCRRPRLDPWSWKIPHTSEQLSLCVRTIEPVLRNKRSPHTATRKQLLLQLEKSPHSNEDHSAEPNTHK